MAEIPGKETSASSLLEIQTQFDRALFGPPDMNSVFVSWPKDEQVRVSEAITNRQVELRNSSNSFFVMLGRVLDPNSQIIRRVRTITINDDGSTFSRAALEVRSNKYPVAGAITDQLYITDHSPNEEEDASKRPDKALAAYRDGLLVQLDNLSRRNTAQAGINRGKILQEYTRVSRIPVATVNIQFQTEQARTLDPKLGIRIIEFLDGFQAFPYVYEGENTVVLYDRPLFRGIEPIKVADLGSKLPFTLISKREFQKTQLGKIKQNLFKKADFD